MKSIYLLLLISNFCFSQNKSDNTYNNSDASKVHFIDDCLKAEEFAYNDIKNNTIFIFLQSGEAPTVYSLDKTFEKKYNVNFNEQGCIGSKCAEAYNQIIFDYLYKTYGNKWMKEIRKDILSYKHWKKNNL